MPESLADRIAQARREKAVRDRADVRPIDVARALGVSSATVSDWESGKISPREDALAKLAQFLGVTPAFLRYGVAGGSVLDRLAVEPELPAADLARQNEQRAAKKSPAKKSTKRAS